jgi:hypothetical protein
VAAAVEIQQAARRINRRLRRHNGLSLHLGIGIATGRVFSGLLGSLQKKEFSSIGMAVNMAARLESMADPVRSCPATRRSAALETVSLEGRFRYTELPPRKIKGFVEPVAVYPDRRLLMSGMSERAFSFPGLHVEKIRQRGCQFAHVGNGFLICTIGVSAESEEDAVEGREQQVGVETQVLLGQMVFQDMVEPVEEGAEGGEHLL